MNAFANLNGQTRRTLLVAGIAITAALPLGAADAAAATVNCAKVASPSGSDSASGSVSAPYRTFQKLSDSLAPGSTGCLRSGNYGPTTVTKGGTAAARITLTSFPGERANVVGRLNLKPTAKFVTVSHMRLQGTGELPSPQINATDAIFENNEVTNNNKGICFNIGHYSTGRGDRFIIRNNRIHHCGVLPVTWKQHGIYANLATDGQITHNTIYSNADRGVKLGASAQRTIVRGNVIDGNGTNLKISSEGHDNPTVPYAPASSGNIIEENVITNAVMDHNIGVLWAGDVGTGNVARRNCLFGAPRNASNGGVMTPMPGFTVSDSRLGDPLYVNRASKDFRLRDDSPCRAFLGSRQVGASAAAMAPTPVGETVIDGTTASPLPAPTPTATPAPTATPTPVPSAPPVASLVEKAAGRATTASSTEVSTSACSTSTTCAAGKAVDTSTTSRWSSAWRDGQWWQVDLGRSRAVERVDIAWYSRSLASSYRIRVSTDGTTWTTVATDGVSAAGVKRTSFASRSARYVRVEGLTRASSYGISFTNVGIHGAAD